MKKILSQMSEDKKSKPRSSRRGAVVEGLIPGIAQWVKDVALR